MSGIIEGLDRVTLPGDGVEIDALVGGEGPPLLLLHGYPQTRMAWHAMAPSLMRDYTLVIPDLRGYGRSGKPAGDNDHKLYSKRQMARDQAIAMNALGFKCFFVAGHDRGGRVAYRLALDMPEAVRAVAVLDIVPTLDVFEASAAGWMGMFHWSFLAQPYPLPETLLNGRSDEFLEWLLQRWTATGWRPDAKAWADCLEAFRDPAALHASCEDYRSGWHVDRLHDLADRGKRRIEAPVLVLWGLDGALAKIEPLEVWRPWCTQVSGYAVPGGHFVPEESPVETAMHLHRFFRSAGV